MNNNGVCLRRKFNSLFLSSGSAARIKDFIMALDIYRSDTNEHFLGIKDEQYNCLYSIFENFSKMTGIYIDQYGDTNLNIKNIKLLVKLIDDYILKTDLNMDKNKTSTILEFKGLLNIFLEKNVSIKLFGD